MSAKKEIYDGFLIDKVMEECSTVDEAIVLFNKYSLYFLRFNNGQLLISDKTGDSAIVGADSICKKTGSYQAIGRACDTAEKMLKNSKKISVDVFKAILEATSYEGEYPTLHSGIYDLQKCVIYLYYFHNFENVVKINLNEELAKGKHSYDLPELFPKLPAAVAFRQKMENEMNERRAARTIADIDPNIYDDYLGEYQVAPWMVFAVTREKNNLYSQIGWMTQKLELFPESENKFFHVLIDGDVEIEFVKDETKKTVALIANWYGKKFRATKIE